MSTKALDVKRQLKATLDALPMVTADDVQVGFGTPLAIERRHAFVGETRWESAEWATNRSRNEMFAVTVGFAALIAGGTAEEAEDYVIRLAAGFESAVSADPSLGGLCVSTTYTPKRVNTWPADAGYESQFEVEVIATCRP